MRVKTFEAASMQDALDTVKKEMGEEAFILSTKTRRRPSALGLGEESVIEVTAAVDEATAPVKAQPPLTYALRAPMEAPAPPRPQAGPPAPPVDLQPLRRELLEIKGAVAALRDQDQRNASILEELDRLKSMLTRLQRQGMPPAQLQLPPSLLDLYSDLTANDVEPMLALRLCEFAQRALAEQEGDAVAGSIDPERARLFLRRVIADFIPVAPPIQLDP
ncbi:MAG TPA: hypothetical protein VF768_04340, partial [Holophagaceae bacterium]